MCIRDRFLWDCVHTIHAILRENKDYRMLEDSVRELAATFRSVSLFPLEEPLSQRITQILEQSDADEKLLKSLENLRAQYEKRLSAFRRTRQRLAAAFPKRLKEARRENAAALFAALDVYKRQVYLLLRRKRKIAEKIGGSREEADPLFLSAQRHLLTSVLYCYILFMNRGERYDETDHQQYIDGTDL